jgi:hypothetical protein
MIEIGKWNKLPHYMVVGQPQAFYIWINEDDHGSNTSWIKGNLPLYHKIKNTKGREATIALLKGLHKSLPKD